MEESLEKGIKPTARKYGTMVKMARKWARRYEEEKKVGLKERSRGLRGSPRATPMWVRCKLVQEGGYRRKGKGTFKSIKNMLQPGNRSRFPDQDYPQSDEEDTPIPLYPRFLGERVLGRGKYPHPPEDRTEVRYRWG